MKRTVSLFAVIMIVIPVASFTTNTHPDYLSMPSRRASSLSRPHGGHKFQVYSLLFQLTSPKTFLSKNDNEGDGDENLKSIEIPSIKSPVLCQVYPALVKHKEKYGNPNIPLGSTDGKRCKTLRRLHFQNKLSDEEVALLTDMDFRFHSFEDVYYECDFDEMLGKLMEYKVEFHTFQIPKKYEPDPELGAWVTMLRRLYRTNDLPADQIEKLDEVGFEWVSTRKCGSSFMSKYREVFSRLREAVEAGVDVSTLLMEDEELKKWIIGQRVAYENGNLSESRMQYMDEIPGVDWRKVK